MSKGTEKVIETVRLNIAKASLYQFDNRLLAMSPLVNQLYDISQNNNPLLLSSFNLSTDINRYSSTFLGLINKKGYFSIGYNIQVIDFINEREPVHIGIINDVLIGGRWEFFSDQYLITNIKTPVIYQIDLPSHMSVVYEFRHDISDFVLANNILICATLVDGIKVYDISQPSCPLLISSLSINAVKLEMKNSKYIFAEGADDIIYIIDVSNAAHVTITTKIEIRGTIASNSLLCKEDLLFVRFKRKTTGDTMQAFNMSNIIKPQKIFEFNGPNTPLYTANNNLLIFMGIKNWDGISPISNYTTSLYKIFRIGSDTIRHLDDIEIEGIWFSSITLSDNTLYIARQDDIIVYKVDF
jgi:hypothetical protein